MLYDDKSIYIYILFLQTILNKRVSNKHTKIEYSAKQGSLSSTYMNFLKMLIPKKHKVSKREMSHMHISIKINVIRNIF